MNNNITAGILAVLLGLSAAQTGTANLIERYDIVPTSAEVSIFNAEDYEALNTFSSYLWSKTASNKNDVISPLSAYLALAMCANGAKGDTIDAFSVLGFNHDDIQKTNEAIKALISRLTDSEGSTVLNIANSVWIDKKFEVNKSFLQTLADYYSAEAFSAKLSDSVGDVNSWIEEKTNGMIKDMLEQIDESIISLLINAVYMKAQFAVPFEKESTYKDDFYSTSGEINITDFMNRVSNERLIDTEDAIGVVLPYDDGRLEFVALMPTDDTLTTSEFISKLNGDLEIGKLASAAKRERIWLSIPKFEAETSLSLSDALKSLGMAPAFEHGADFSGIGYAKTGEGLSIGDVLQNARLKLDENGTEAAAATVVSIRVTSILNPEQPREVKFNRPFVYAVIDSETGVILFCGSYNKAE
jgi:serine protease inhibitor